MSEPKLIPGTVQFGDEEPVTMPFLVVLRDDIGLGPSVLVPIDRELADGDTVTFRFDWSAE